MSEPFIGLEEISIRNLGVIESAHIDFKPGLNVLTGETGAGKTMVLTALSLVLGGKADSDRVRTGTDRLIASGRFALGEEMRSVLSDLDAEIEDGAVLISRTVMADGKSRIQLGGTASTAGKVSEVGESLIEIHAQSSTQRLAKPAYIRSLVDSYAKNSQLLKKMSDCFFRHQELIDRIEKLRSDQKNREVEISRLKEFAKAFEAVTPKLGELGEIEVEIGRLSSVDDLQQSVAAALNYLDSDEYSVTSALNNAKKTLDHSLKKDPALDEIGESLGDTIFTFEESLSALQRYLSKLDADPKKLDYLQERKSNINSLIKKYGEGTDREVAFALLIERANEVSQRIADLEGGDQRIAELEADVNLSFTELREVALLLDDSRRSVSENLSGLITNEIHALSMANAEIKVLVTTADPDNFVTYSQHGINEVTILFTSHTGSQPGPLTKFASGGELSRVMLAIEVVLAANSMIPTYVFDEVDSGVGGKAAMEVGKRLAQLADKSQVIVVTHLAQVAVWATNHLVVQKNETGSIGISDVMTLSEEQRRVEIARMLSGQEDSASAQEHAQELLEMVRKRMIS